MDVPEVTYSLFTVIADMAGTVAKDGSLREELLHDVQGQLAI